MRISEETILAIEEAVQVEEVLSSFVSLQRKGKKYLCPFHSDTHPSFSITSDGKFYKCFSCSAQGSSVSFLMEQQQMSYPQAMKYLAEKYHVPWRVTGEDAAQVAQEKAREALYLLLDKAKVYYQERLRNDPLQTALDYLKRRDLGDPALLEAFGLGYSLPEWRGFHAFAVAEGYDDALLQEAGLVLTKEKVDETVVYDRFRGRLMFPIYNLVGKVIGFGGRILVNEDARTPKYINSPETPVYHKSDVLYGLYQAKQAIKKEDNSYLVEGYTDVLAMHQAGIQNVVASGGTALTKAQIALLHRFTHQVTLLFDGDLAGQEAALRGIDLLLAQGCDVKIVCLPPKEDPDSFRKKEGSQALQTYLKAHVKDFITFKSDLLFAEVGEDPLKQAKATTALLATIGHIPDPLKRTFYVQSCAQRLGLDEALLQTKMEELLTKGPSSGPSFSPRRRMTRRKAASVAKTHPTSHRERTVLYFLLHYADYVLNAEQRLADYLFENFPDIVFSEAIHQILWDQFKTQWYAEGPFRGQDFIASQNEEIQGVAQRIMQRAKALSENWQAMYHIIFSSEEDNLAKSSSVDVQRLQMAYLSDTIRDKMEKMAQATTQEEQEKHWSDYQALKKRQNEIATALGTTVLHHHPLPPYQP